LNKFFSESDVQNVNYRHPDLADGVSPDVGGVRHVDAESLAKGCLPDPEEFFFSRCSVREFSDRPVKQEIVKRAVSLALKTPSVCNRQAWFVYHIDDQSIIGRCLELQNGNSGFGHKIKSLLIITSDLKAFDTGSERYQHWIDGGMFSMSLVYALHSLGVASCCLNWSKVVRDNIRIRKRLPIEPHHTIIMMLAIGYPSSNIKVCYSARRPLENVYRYFG
jgi:nitroreductase